LAGEPEITTRPESKAGRFLPLLAVAPFYGWWVLLVLASLRVVASGVGNNVRSLLVLPLENEFGATRAEVSLMATSGSIAVALTGPLGGWLMDRFGTRRVMFVCLLITAAGYFLLSQSQALWHVIFIFTIPLGVAYNWAILNSGAPILNNWFDRQKARALSLLNVGHGAGALILPLMALAITGLGWRPAMIIGGAVLLIAGLAVIVVARDTPEEMGLTPDGDPAQEYEAAHPAASMAGATLGQAVRDPFFWAVSIGSACMLFINLSIVFHMVPLVQSRGESEGLGATLLSLQLFLTVPIVLVTAWGADRLDGSRVLVVMMALTLAGVLALLAADGLLTYLIAMALLAFGGSHWAILWAVLGHKYGRRHYNAIRMSIYSILIAGMAAAPLLAGISFDATQSYTLWLQILLGVGMLGVATFVYGVKAARIPVPGVLPRLTS
jgi:MFS family permease